MNLSYGSQGDDVKKLQESLNKQGYSLSVDGIFGSKTQQAVKDYQSKNNLAVDGIAGQNTLGKLYATSTSTSGNTNTEAAAKPVETPTPPAELKYAESDYASSDAVKQAEAMLSQQLSAKPGEYQSQWQAQLNDTINKILNREEFSYDLNGDALYQQYKDQYTTKGKLAMQDTMGQAAALTGGYGNSYASTAGNQAYQGYLQQLNEVVPELYQLALDRYNQEGQDLYNQYSLLGAQEEQDYGRFRDQYADWQTERDYLANQYNTERDFAYGQFADDKSYAYQAERDKIADEQWKTEFDEAVRQFNQQMGLASGGSSSGGSSGGSGGSGSGSGSGDGSGGGGYDAETAAIQQQLKDAGYEIVVDGIWGPKTQEAYDDYKSKGNTSPYDQILGTVATASGIYSKQSASDQQRSYKESAAAINEAYKEGLITAAQKKELLNIAMPGPR